jgi:hypothetical protein
MSAPTEPLECWVVTDGRAGIENQALGLAEAVARIAPSRITLKRIIVKLPWRVAPRSVWGDPFARLSTEGALLRPPFPDLWIACGRVSAPFTRGVKLRDPKVFTVQVQSPRMPAEHFDLVIPPLHDNLAGPNVFPILGSPNRIVAETIAKDAEILRTAVGALPAPRVAMLIGGPNRAFKMREAAIMRIARIARAFARQGAGVMVTTSRRTPAAVAPILRRALARFPHFLWDGAPVGGLENPYFGLLGLADHILVTEDSVNMAVEAAGTGKPLHIVHLDRRRLTFAARKFDRFHEALRARGASRMFAGRVRRWSYPPVDETARAAAEIMRRWSLASAAPKEE